VPDDSRSSSDGRVQLNSWYMWLADGRGS
jgi:hypothetical protein